MISKTIAEIVRSSPIVSLRCHIRNALLTWLLGLCAREWWQRERLFELGLQEAGMEAAPGDLIILGDVDEIPRPEALMALKRFGFEAVHNCAAMEADLFYYSYSLYSGVWKAGPKVCHLAMAAQMHSAHSTGAKTGNLNVKHLRQSATASMHSVSCEPALCYHVSTLLTICWPKNSCQRGDACKDGPAVLYRLHTF